MKMRVLLIDDNEMFVNNFEDYIFKNHNLDFDFYVFTSASKYLSSINETQKKYDVLLVNPIFYEQVKTQINTQTTILISSGNIPAEYEHLHHLNKFKPAQELINEINRLYINESNHILINEASDRTKIISFYSPIGGSGKTTSSIVFANILAKEGKKVLYIPLEFMFGDALLYGKLKEYDITYLLCNTSNKHSLKFELNKIKGTNEKTNLDYLPGFQNPKDYYSLDEKSWDDFLETMVKHLEYDYIVIDLINSFDSATINLLNKSDTIMFVASKGYVEGYKFIQTINYLSKNDIVEDLLDKSILINNSAKNTRSSTHINRNNFKDDYDIGYDSALKKVVDGQVVYNLDSTFARELTTIVFNHFK